MPSTRYYMAYAYYSVANIDQKSICGFTYNICSYKGYICRLAKKRTKSPFIYTHQVFLQKKSSSIGLYSLSRKKVCTLASSCSLTLAQLSYLLNHKVFSSWCTVRQLSELTNVSALFFWIDCTCICKRYLVSHKHRQN